MEEPKVFTDMYMSHAMDDSLRGLAFANRCARSELIHQAIQEYTCPVKKEALAAINNEDFNIKLRKGFQRDIERLGIPFEDLPPPVRRDDDTVLRSLHLSRVDFNKVADCARKGGVSRQVIFRDLLQKYLDKHPRTP